MKKPENLSDVASNAWDAICANYKLRECDTMALTMLCEWYAIADRCNQLLKDESGTTKHVVVLDADGNQQIHKAIAAMQMAQASIAAISKQLGIEPDAEKIEIAKEKKTPLELAREGRAARMRLVDSA